MIRAIHYPEYEKFKAAATPGSFHVVEREIGNVFEMSYYCPCGCGHLGRLLLGMHHKPGGDRPSWMWNGSRTDPHLQPSVNHVDHWHGWLRNGYWVSV